MTGKTNWYFEGWKKDRAADDNGHRKTIWKYTGAYYQFQLDKRHFIFLKAGYICLCVLLILIWTGFSFVAAVGRESAVYVGGPWFVQSIPFMYLVIGTSGIWRSGDMMTYRDVCAGYNRIRWVKWILLILQSVCFTGEIIFFIKHSSDIDYTAEIIWTTGVLLCIAVTICIFIIQRRYPPYQVAE